MSTFKRGEVVVVGHETTSYSARGGCETFGSARLAVVTSVARDGSAIRALCEYSSEAPVKVDAKRDRYRYGVLDGVSADVLDAFRYEHRYTWQGEEVAYHSPVVVFGGPGDDSMREAARYLRDAVLTWQQTGEVPRGHNPEHPESIHLSHLAPVA